jgi:hypothetical protein
MRDDDDYDLFSYPHRPGYKEHTTSRRAAEEIEQYADTLRGQVYRTIRRFSPCGITPDETAELLDKSVLSVRPRCSELQRLGLIEPTRELRMNKTGKWAHVLRASK